MNGRFGEQSAEDLTAEIDRATGEMAERAETEGAQSGSMSAERAQQAGQWAMKAAGAIFSGETGEGSAEASAEQNYNQIKSAVAAENGYAGQAIEGAANVIGGESEVQIAEREKSDADTLKIQTGEGLSPEEKWKQKIANQSAKVLTESVEQEVGEIVKEKEFNPKKLESLRFSAMVQALKADEGYMFGGRN